MPYFAGSFLVAKAVLQDPSFRQTVVLILQHGPDGAFGLVVNRKAKVKKLPLPIFAGGPCESPGLIMLHGHAEWLDDSDNAAEKGEVAPGIFLGDGTCVERVTEQHAGEEFRFRMFNGYAGWGPSQLEGELAAGAWSVVPANGELLFDIPSDELWDQLSPPSLPQFSVN